MYWGKEVRIWRQLDLTRQKAKERRELKKIIVQQLSTFRHCVRLDVFTVISQLRYFCVWVVGERGIEFRRKVVPPSLR